MDNRTQFVPRTETEAMAVDAQGTSVVARIGFAERWLHRARTQCAEGDVTGGLLTLALADAEVRYALEAGGWRAASRRARRSERNTVGWLSLAAAAAALALVWSWPPVGGPTAAADFDGPPVIRFSSDLGTLLSPAPVSLPPASAPAGVAAGRTAEPNRTVVRPTTIHPAATPKPARPAVAVSPAAPGAVPPLVAASTGSPTPSPTAVAGSGTSPGGTTPVILSEADLIDMVIAASRALQGTGP